MKTSFYNLFFKIGDKFIIYNTLNSSISELSDIYYDVFQSPEWDLTQHTEEANLFFTKQGYIISSDYDEIGDYLKKFESHRNPNKLEVQIFFAFSCNLTCKYCYQRAPQKNGVMSISNFHRFTNWISNELFTGQYSQCSIEIYGGEPLLAKRLIKILFDELALTLKKTNIPIDYDIVTNGTLLDDEIIKLFIINDVYMQITIDGDRETHNQRRAYRNGKGSYDKIISNISSIIKQGGNDLLKVRMNVDTKNFTQISNVASKLHSINVKNFELGWVNFLSPISPDYSHSINSSDFENLMIEIYNVLKPFGYAPTIDNFSVITTCMFHRFHGFTITPELDVFKCDELMDFKKYKLGFIDENSLLVIDKVRYDQFLSRKPSNFHECVNCRLLPVCGCGCAVQALRSKGELHQNYCETTYKKIETRIKNFILVSEI